MPTGDPPYHTCVNAGNWLHPTQCGACQTTFQATGWVPYAPTALSDSDIERIAQRVAELLKDK